MLVDVLLVVDLVSPALLLGLLACKKHDQQALRI
jgi:hypothetical protein